MHFRNVLDHYGVDSEGESSPQSECLVRLPDPEELLRQFLRCSTCRNFDRPPISLCKKGHPICVRCFEDEELSFCTYIDEKRAVCQSSFLQNLPMQLYHYLHSNSTFFCQNRTVGCPAALLGSDLKDHVKVDCKFRNLSRCIFTACNSMKGAKLADYEMHLVDDHGLDRINDFFARISTPYDISFKNGNTQSRVIISCHNAKFMVVTHCFNHRLAIWTSIISKPQRSAFRATYFLKFNEQTAAKLSMAKPAKAVFHEVHMPHVPIEEIIELCECVDLAKQVVETRFLNKDAKSGEATLYFEVLIEPAPAYD